MAWWTEIKTPYNRQYNQCRAQWQLESVCPAPSFVTVDSDVARIPPLVILQTVTAKCKKTTQQTICYIKTEKNEINEQPMHKTAHLQTAQADTRPKFTKELFHNHTM